VSVADQGGGTDFVTNSEPVPRQGTKAIPFKVVSLNWLTEIQQIFKQMRRLELTSTSMDSDSGGEWLSDDSSLELDEAEIEDSEDPEDEDSWTETILTVS
jgi:hypothetical protein